MSRMLKNSRNNESFLVLENPEVIRMNILFLILCRVSPSVLTRGVRANGTSKRILTL